MEYNWQMVGAKRSPEFLQASIADKIPENGNPSRRIQMNFTPFWAIASFIANCTTSTIVWKSFAKLGDPAPVPPESTEPSEPEEEPESEGDSDYETALAYQNTETRWYSAIQRFLFQKKQGLHLSSMMDLHNRLAPKFNQSQSE
ncbi:hypothetical protein GLOIN_2v1471985 [Rhizophagus clarus]|uniref:Uncharacterized protein n=1 Tax=Rhizophagus clarus TaxID=94130 RepID=A0A8H3L739_9GLOM|nr:hypothetical protein GLOIN_2v1471985 [Rhizophagus clarus]